MSETKSKMKASTEPSSAAESADQADTGQNSARKMSGKDGSDPMASSGTPGGAPAANELQELRARAAKADEYWDRLVQVTADLENFRKRAAREKQDAIRFANESLLGRLIPALDNFEMAQAAAGNADAATVESLKTGISLIHGQLKNALADAGLEEIDASGQIFNPNIHEAVSQEDSAEVPEGQVIRQLRKGYKLRERLIRPASVVVARKPSS